MRWGGHWGGGATESECWGNVATREQEAPACNGCLVFWRRYQSARVAFSHVDWLWNSVSVFVSCLLTKRPRLKIKSFSGQIYKEVFMYWYVGAKTATNPTTASATLMAVWKPGWNVRFAVGVLLAACRENESQLPAPSTHLMSEREPLLWWVLMAELLVSTVAAALCKVLAVTRATTWTTPSVLRSFSTTFTFVQILQKGCNFSCPHLC